MKTCTIIAGPNGAGKTTFALRYLPEIAHCVDFINADLIAQGLSSLNSQQAQIKAGRLFLDEIRRYSGGERDFAFETTLSGRGYAQRKNGWRIVLFYLWIPSIAFSSARVKERVKEGGHDIPIEAIERRYSKSLYNLPKKRILNKQVKNSIN